MQDVILCAEGSLRLIGLILLALLLFTRGALGQQEFKTSVQPLGSENLRTACSFELWLPPSITRLSAVWITYDRGRDVTRYYTDVDVRAFAQQHAIALMLAHQCPAKVPPTGEQGEMDMDVSRGVARSLSAALEDFARQTHHPEVSSAQLILLGFSGIGAMFGHLIQYAPDRVLAAILANPGQTEPYGMKDMNLSASALAVPQLIIVGGSDDRAGTQLPFEYFQRHEAQGAPWVFVVQNGIAHCCVSNAKPLILEWLGEMMKRRQPASGKPLERLSKRKGWLGYIRPCPPHGKDSKGEALWNVCAASIERMQKAAPKDEEVAAWFPSRRFASEWMSFVQASQHPDDSSLSGQR